MQQGPRDAPTLVHDGQMCCALAWRSCAVLAGQLRVQHSSRTPCLPMVLKLAAASLCSKCYLLLPTAFGAGVPAALAQAVSCAQAQSFLLPAPAFPRSCGTSVMHMNLMCKYHTVSCVCCSCLPPCSVPARC